MRRDRVVAGGDLEVEPRRQHVLAEDRARPARHGEDERDAGDRAVLHALRAGGAHDSEAARFEVEHRETLRVAHERLRPGAGGEAHLHAARRVGRAEERLRPRRVVAVDEHGLGAVHGERLRVGHEAADRELEVAALLDRALRHRSRPSGLRADEERDRVQRRVARDADRRLHLGEAAPRRLGRVGGEERRALLEVRHVRLVRGRAPRAELLQREHQLDRVEQPDDARELRRRKAAGQPDELGARDVHVDEPAGEVEIVERHGLDRDLEVETVRDDEAVDDVEVGRAAAVHARDDSVLDDELRLRIVRPVRRDEPELGQRRDELLEVEIARRARREAAATHRRAVLAPRTQPRPRGRTPPSSRPPCASSRGSPLLQLGGGGAARTQRRVDLEQQLVGDRSELRGALEALRELRPARRERDRGLHPKRLRRRANLVGARALPTAAPPA